MKDRDYSNTFDRSRRVVREGLRWFSCEEESGALLEAEGESGALPEAEGEMDWRYQPRARQLHPCQIQPLWGAREGSFPSEVRGGGIHTHKTSTRI